MVIHWQLLMYEIASEQHPDQQNVGKATDYLPLLLYKYQYVFKLSEIRPDTLRKFGVYQGSKLTVAMVANATGVLSFTTYIIIW